MGVIEFFAGLVVGAGGMVAKDKYIGKNDDSQIDILRQEANKLSDENERLRKRASETESQVEELIAENDKLRRRAKDIDNDSEDLQDDLTAAKKEIRKLQAQNEELNRTIQDYKAVCANYEEQIAKLKKQ